MKEPAYLPKEVLVEFFSGLLSRRLYGTVEKKGVLLYSRLASTEDLSNFSVDKARSYESIRPFFMPVKERVSLYPEKEGSWRPDFLSEPPLAIMGARACDLEALAIVETVMATGDFEEPFYTERRNKAFIVSSDCREINPACFCNLVGGQPFPKTGFDINLSPVEGGFVIESASEKGKKYIEENASFLKEATPAQIEQREKMRSEVMENLNKQNEIFPKAQEYLSRLGKAEKEELWERLSANCVECGACTNTCPTCHCFLLFDQIANAEEGTFERLKVWDSCLFGDYARMAGVVGMKPNPRPRLADRFRNRLFHKFVYFYQNFDRLGCTGCGRCIEACLGGLDIRDALKEMVRETSNV